MPEGIFRNWCSSPMPHPIAGKNQNNQIDRLHFLGQHFLELWRLTKKKVKAWLFITARYYHNRFVPYRGDFTYSPSFWNLASTNAFRCSNQNRQQFSPDGWKAKEKKFVTQTEAFTSIRFLHSIFALIAISRIKEPSGKHIMPSGQPWHWLKSWKNRSTNYRAKIWFP